MGEAVPGEVPVSTSPRPASQRVRLGLTGLAAIFLLVLVAAVLVQSGRPAVSTEAGVRPMAIQASLVPTPQAESLAMLGVAPGATEPNNDARVDSGR